MGHGQLTPSENKRDQYSHVGNNGELGISSDAKRTSGDTKFGKFGGTNFVPNFF
jgi:hypothetical protein